MYRVTKLGFVGAFEQLVTLTWQELHDFVAVRAPLWFQAPSALGDGPAGVGGAAARVRPRPGPGHPAAAGLRHRRRVGLSRARPEGQPTMQTITFTLNGDECTIIDRPRSQPAGRAARRPRADRGEEGLRPRALRRVRRAGRRTGGHVLPVPGEAGRGEVGRDGRGHRHAGAAARHPAGLRRGGRRPVRVLHARHGRAGQVVARHQSGAHPGRDRQPPSNPTCVGAPAT